MDLIFNCGNSMRVLRWTGALSVGLMLLLVTPVAQAQQVIFATSRTDQLIKEFLTDGSSVSNFVSSVSLSIPDAIDFDSSGNLFVANQGTNSVLKITPGGTITTFASGFGNQLFSLVIDNSDNVYVSSLIDSTIIKITPGGSQSTFATTGVSNAQGLAIDSSGNIYAANAGNNTIEKFTPAGSASLFTSSSVSGPIGMTFDSGGNLYVANKNSGLIMKYGPGGGTGTVFSNSASLSSFIGSMVMDSSDNLYVANTAGNNILKITQAGAVSVLVTMNSPFGLAIEAIPEPATTVMISGTVGLALAVWRRRRRDQS